MDMTNIVYELANSKASLAFAGLTWLSVTACRMLNESDEKYKDAEKRAREAEAELAEVHAQEVVGKDICCDGKASVTKKEV